MNSQSLDVTRLLAKFVVNGKFEDFPLAVRAESERAFVNWVGCAIGGCRMPAVETAAGLLDVYSGPREASVIGRKEKLDIFSAAFLNSMSNASRSFNDTHLRTVAHPSASVVAALLALVETHPVSGREFLEALILGNELQCRIGNILVTPPAQSQYALSMIALAGGVGASVAAAKLLKLDEQHTLYAIGLALAQSGGTRATHGSMGGRMLSGEAARAGLMSAKLAERGFTSPEEVISGSKGFAVAYAKNADPHVAIDQLGEKFEILDLAYKPYPCGIVIHPIIDACLDLVRKYNFTADEVLKVRIEAPQSAIDLTSRRNPIDGNAAGTSLFHWVAASFIDRAAGFQQASNEYVRSPHVIDLRERVEAVADPDLASDAARAEVHLRDGRIFSHEVKHARGSAARPLTNDDLSEKFLGQARLYLPYEFADDILNLSWTIQDAHDVGTHLEPLLRFNKS